VTDVLRIPDELDHLENVLEKAIRLAQRGTDQRSIHAPDANGGKVIALYSGKGGAGTTTVSVNLAQTIALQTDAKVLLIDLNLQFGGIQHYLDIQFERNLGDLKSVLKEITYSQLSNVLYPLQSSGLNLHICKFIQKNHVLFC